MASQAYIIDAEDKLITANQACIETIAVIKAERKSNIRFGMSELPGGDQGTLNRENRDCWNTLLLNAKALQRNLTDLITDLGKEL